MVETRFDQLRASAHRRRVRRRTCERSVGNNCSFQETHAGINGRSIESRHVGRWHNPWQTGLIEPHLALPIFHWQDRQSTFRKSLVSKLLSEFADCFSMPHWNRMEAYK